jgi:hypothetical protein
MFVSALGFNSCWGLVMIEEAKYHEMRAAQERAIAARTLDAAAKQLHTALSDRHADRAWSIRENSNSESAK